MANDKRSKGYSEDLVPRKPEKGSNAYSQGPAYVKAIPAVGLPLEVSDVDKPPEVFDVGLPSEVFHDELNAIIARRNKANVDLPPDKHYFNKSRDKNSDSDDVLVATTELGLTGLAISGGGIRSATFSLGVMQALAGADILKNFDYMSTVSGGGYSGSSLTWALYGQPEKTRSEEVVEDIEELGVGPDSFPIGTDDPRKATPDGADPKRIRLLKYLREHGKYLTPGGGISALSFISVLLRGMLLNLLIWFALAGCLIYFTRLVGAEQLLGENFGFDAFRSWTLTIILLLVFVVISVAYALGTYLPVPHKWRYSLRRAFEKVSVPLFALLFLAVAIGTIGWVYVYIENFVKTLSAGMILSGGASGLWAYLQTASEKPGQKSKIPVGLVATVGALLLMYGAIIGAYAGTCALANCDTNTFAGSSTTLVGWILGFTLITGWFVNINQISLHRYYRDRLMETFLPGFVRAIRDTTGPSPEADHAKLSEMWDHDDPRGPYHIINTNLVTVDSTHRTQRTRGGDSFILSPFYCGGTATGWRRTEMFERNNMTLATAMAISAAAANPNSGVAGQGVTRNKFVSLLMALLNLRLGYWTHRPSKARIGWYSPNHFWPGGMYELLSRFKETSVWLQLTDGGHFENLALYEMIRRRLKLIVVLDGGADPDFTFADLQNACRRIATDFGAQIKFSKNLSTLTYKQWSRDEKDGVVTSGAARGGSSGFPKYYACAKKGWVHGTIHYAGGKEKGDIIYIKTTMVKGLSLTTQGYKDRNPTFPDETTADQFFEPEQFAAYRELGYVIGKSAVSTIKNPAKARAKARAKAKAQEGAAKEPAVAPGQGHSP